MHLALSWALSRNPGGRQTRRPSRFLNGIAPNTQANTPSRPRKPRGPTPRCRVCNNALTTPAAVMLRRCEGCPSDIDEQLLADLKDWRLPTDEAALVAIPGIGARKLEQFGPDVLAMVKGRQKS